MDSDSLSLVAPRGQVLAAGSPAPQRTDGSARALAQAQAGDSAAFRELVCAHQTAIYSLALRMLAVREDAQELTQDVFLLLHRHLAGIGSPAHLRFWLRKTVCHRAIDRLRSRRVAALPLDAVPEPEAPSPDGDPILERQLRALVGKLPAMPRAVLLLRYQEDLDPMEIAEVLSLSLNTVKSHLRRSLALLRSRCERSHGWRAEGSEND